ncbi:MAG: hypothetical protein ACRD2Q_05655 [Terriglobales bacterium]
MYCKPIAVILVLAGCAVWSASAVSQELRVNRMRMVPSQTTPDGKEWSTLEWDAGETVSKQGVVIPFEAHWEGGKSAGFRFQRAPLMSLKPGDQLRMYVTGLEAEPNPMLDPAASGPWRLVTVVKLRVEPNQIHLEIAEKLRRKGGSVTQEIVLTASGGQLLSGEAPAAATGTPATGQPWSLVDVPLWAWVAILGGALAGISALVFFRRR